MFEYTETYNLLKALHLIAMVAWFAGLFYLVRLFVYHREAFDREEGERRVLTAQYHVMERRLYKIICNPAMMATWTFGLVMIFMQGMDWLALNPWLHVKITLVLLLTIYHLYCKRVIKRLAKADSPATSYGFRLFNEVPTLFLVAIIILAVYKNMTNFGYTFGGIIILALILYLIVRVYKNSREKS